MQTETAPAPAPLDPSVVCFEAVRFRWPGARDFSLSIDDFQLPRGRTTLLLGPSGSGKSTLLNLLCGIVQPQSGRIEILGQDMTNLSAAARDRFRAEHFGIIFQLFNLLPYASVLDNILLPLSFAEARHKRARQEGNGDARSCARHMMAALGLADDLALQPAATLSVGQQQRVAAARALVGAPEIIVADEPTSSLDRVHQDRFLDLLFQQIEQGDATLLMVSHDETLGSRFDHVVRLSDVVDAGAEV